jgi:PhnB protein
MPKPQPDGYPSLSPYLIVRDGDAAVTFYRTVLGAQERMRIPAPGGRIAHAELAIGDSLFMLADEPPGLGTMTPPNDDSRHVMLHLYVADVDATMRTAEQAGGRIVHPVETKFYGDRSGTFLDPFGHTWHVSTHVEDVSPEEITRRAAALGPEA